MMKSDPLASLLHITDIGYYPHAAHHYRVRNEPIDEYVFIYCIDGAGWYETDGRKRDVETNQYFILPAGKKHVYGSNSDRPWTIYWIHFGGPLAVHYAGFASEPQTITPSANSRINHRINLFEEIFTTLQSSLTIESLRYAMSTFHHYLASLLYIKEYRNAGNERVGSDIVEHTIHFLGENIERHLSIKEIADFTGFSSTYISALFKERTGYSILNYFNVMKIRKACELLDTTAIKVNQLSFKLGFDDPFYFSRLFSKIMGMSPKGYRERLKA